ncbi:hypothetical protein J0895_09545 [Phormidium pseudopriestleyi FRX01]|uniref:Uncharacterized protein n=1 Tax=Phormidium pseudopriestleyi FRX01 TaxID=1759528 RepID=A0ABS3FRV1_9CYAN|nr:hypothetical protein [Phormidium pseudopriestleyi]MBO0349346.1 hypothetical protein [Phormidium pseudopriestleyi FRX01]
MVIELTINFSDGPRTLARGGLGWGVGGDVAIATSRTMSSLLGLFLLKMISLDWSVPIHSPKI